MCNPQAPLVPVGIQKTMDLGMRNGIIKKIDFGGAINFFIQRLPRG